MHPYLFIYLICLSLINVIICMFEFIFMFHFSQFCFAVLFWLSCWIACSPAKDVCPCYHSDSHIVSFPKFWKDSFLTLWRLLEITQSSLMVVPLNFKCWILQHTPLDISTHPCRTFSYCTCILHLYYLYVRNFLC